MPKKKTKNKKERRNKGSTEVLPISLAWLCLLLKVPTLVLNCCTGAMYSSNEKGTRSGQTLRNGRRARRRRKI